MAYATISKPGLHFNTKLFTGNGSNDHAITGVGFQPDWVWIKARNQAYDHMIHDSVRGQYKNIRSNLTNAEATDTSGVKSFDSDGFTTNNGGYTNGNSVNFASWNWKAGGTGSSNTDGNVTATVSANTTAGFSIVSWASNGQEQSIGHGLGATPSVIIMKTRGTGDGWIVGHKDNGWAYYQVLQGTNAKISDDRMFSPSGGSDPTNSVWWTNSTAWVTGGSTDCIAYCFAEKKGYSKFGSYTGNASTNGPFIYTGFKPAWVMWKKSSSTEDWGVSDNKRDTFNVMQNKLRPNANNTESTSNAHVDWLSNGFKWRSASGEFNGSGGTYIYMAFAEEPLVANVGESIPATAR